MAKKPFEPVGTTMTIGSFALNWITITPPAVNGGDPIDTVTLGNTAWKTKIPQTLKDCDAMQFTAEMEHGANFMTGAMAVLNKVETITITVSGGVSWTFKGFLRSINPDEFQVGERATCSGEVVVTNSTWTSAGTVDTESAPYA